MSKSDNMVLVLLREMRAAMDARFNDVDARIDNVEKQIGSLRQAFHGESILGRYAVSDVEGRLKKLEKRMKLLDA